MIEPVGDGVRDAKVRQFFAEPDRYLARNPALFVRAALVGSIVAPARPRRVLDLGCGDGKISLVFAEQAEHLALVDRSPQMIERARVNTPPEALTKVDFVVSEIDRFSSTRCYDLVLCLGVLAHVESPEPVVAKAAELCAPGGLCIVQLTDTRHPLGRALRLYDVARDRLRGRRGRGYATARTSVEDVVDMGQRRGLRRQQVRRYTPALPGTSYLPLRWAQSLQLHLSAPASHAGRGSEALVVFTKEPRDGVRDLGA